MTPWRHRAVSSLHVYGLNEHAIGERVSPGVHLWCHPLHMCLMDRLNYMTVTTELYHARGEI